MFLASGSILSHGATSMRHTMSSKGRALVVAAVAAAAIAQSTTPANADPGNSPFTFAVIGDIPYGDAQITRFPQVVDQINADPSVRLVDHLGDIKSGSSTCDDTYFAAIRRQFDRFQDPLVYTPGDNEWTDCHRANNGGYNPLERLSAVRQLFFPRPGHTLGQHSVGVASQAQQGLPENVLYTRAGVTFAAVHVVGSDNSLVPWTGQTQPTAEQIAEEQHRTEGDVELINQAFDDAEADGDRAVALLMQADMFDPSVGQPRQSDFAAFTPIVQAVAERAADFDGPVYLFNGDSHAYNVDRPLATGSPWLSFYGVDNAADNLTRITVDGSTGVNNYLRVRVDPHDPAVLTWERVPFAS
jgi:hypothetical protein